MTQFPHKSCRTPDICRQEQFCLDGWRCASDGPFAKEYTATAQTTGVAQSPTASPTLATLFNGLDPTMTDRGIDELISDLLTTSEHCPTRDIIAARLISNLRQKVRELRAASRITPSQPTVTATESPKGYWHPGGEA